MVEDSRLTAGFIFCYRCVFVVESGQTSFTTEDIRNGAAEPTATARHGTHEDVRPTQTRPGKSKFFFTSSITLLRFDLKQHERNLTSAVNEKVRNLCYMVSRREKLSRSYFRLREQTFHKQVVVLSSSELQQSLSSTELNAIRQANHGSNIYDMTYSRADSCPKVRIGRCFVMDGRFTRELTDECLLNPLKEDFEKVVQLIGGLESNVSQLKKEKNGVIGRSGNHGSKSDNPYKRTYMNGGDSRRSRSLSSISSESLASDSESNSRWKKQVPFQSVELFF